MTRILNTRLYNPLYHDFIKNNHKISEFLISPHELDWIEFTRRVPSPSKIHQNVKSLLAEQNTDLISKNAKTYLQDLRNENSYIVITGQQIGLFASPLYTIFKAVTTVKLAEKLNSQGSQFKYIPVFWLESEDHDFKEVNHFGVWMRDFTAHKIEYQGLDRGKISLRHYQIDEEIVALVQETKKVLLETEFSEDLFRKIEKYYALGESWVFSTRNFLKELFHDTGLLFFQPGHQGIKKISSEFYLNLIDESDTVVKAFAQRSQQVEQAGYTLQVPDIPGKRFIHLEMDTYQREHLYGDKEDFFFKSSDRKYSSAQVKQIITNNPEKISTSVISRPLLQSWLMPVVAYIAGPAEIAYWSQLGRLFDVMKITMPIVYPRISASLLEPKIVRQIEKHRTDVENMPQNKQQFLDNYFKNKTNLNGNNPFDHTRGAITQMGDHIISYLKGLDPTLVDAGRKTFERIQSQIDAIEQKSIRVREQKDHTLLSHLKQIHEAIFPAGQPQERYISIIYFLNKFGPAIFKEIYQGLDIEKFEHQLLILNLE
jgi:bacillithiol biosynthesis cysteine-adding enzyme BshC